MMESLAWVFPVIGYGLTYAGPGLEIMSQVEASYVIFVVSVTMNNPGPATWHMENAQNGGATYEQVVGIRDIGVKVAKACGYTPFEGEVPHLKKKASYV